MLTLEEASARVLACANPSSESELVVLETCPGRVLVDDIRSDSDLPAFDRSAMDGFALRAADLAALPATLRVVDEIAAGALASHRVEPGTAARIMTGAPIPDGADSVVMVEHTESVETSGDEELVRIHRSVAPRENIRFRAENVAEGEIVLPAGHRLRPIDVAILATAGIDRVAVRPRPRVSRPVASQSGARLLPMPNIGNRRPSLRTSMVAHCLASSSGSRRPSVATFMPNLMRWVAPASAAMTSE